MIVAKDGKVAFLVEFERGDAASMQHSLTPLKVCKNGGIKGHLLDSPTLPESAPGFNPVIAKSLLAVSQPPPTLSRAPAVDSNSNNSKPIPQTIVNNTPASSPITRQPSLGAYSQSAYQRKQSFPGSTPTTPSHPKPTAVLPVEQPKSLVQPLSAAPIRAPSISHPACPQPIRVASMDGVNNKLPHPMGLLDFSAGSYEVVLLLDSREVKNGNQRDFFQQALAEKGINVERRSLELGDFMWIAKRQGTQNLILSVGLHINLFCIAACETGAIHDEENEIVLDFVLERKTLDDLVASIKDGRFKEQKVGCWNFLFYVFLHRTDC
jgi:crossover junction endonuclease MUS81